MIGRSRAAMVGDAPMFDNLVGSQTRLEYMSVDDTSRFGSINRGGAPISWLIGMIESTAQLGGLFMASSINCLELNGSRLKYL